MSRFLFGLGALLMVSAVSAATVNVPVTATIEKEQIVLSLVQPLSFGVFKKPDADRSCQMSVTAGIPVECGDGVGATVGKISVTSEPGYMLQISGGVESGVGYTFTPLFKERSTTNVMNPLSYMMTAGGSEVVTIVGRFDLVQADISGGEDIQVNSVVSVVYN